LAQDTDFSIDGVARELLDSGSHVLDNSSSLRLLEDSAGGDEIKGWLNRFPPARERSKEVEASKEQSE
jgi:hypothetical protein